MVIDSVHEKLIRFGDLAVSLEAELRPLHEEGRTSDALVAIAVAMEAAAARARVEHS
jgi:hypothetical protein